MQIDEPVFIHGENQMLFSCEKMYIEAHVLCVVRRLWCHQQSRLIASTNDIFTSWRCTVFILYKNVTSWTAGSSAAWGGNVLINTYEWPITSSATHHCSVPCTLCCITGTSKACPVYEVSPLTQLIGPFSIFTLLIGFSSWFWCGRLN